MSRLMLLLGVRLGGLPRNGCVLGLRRVYGLTLRTSKRLLGGKELFSSSVIERIDLRLIIKKAEIRVLGKRTLLPHRHGGGFGGVV